MMKRLAGIAGNNSGASALEFAILLPVFVTMLLGTVQVGMLFYQAGTVQHALEDTAREVMVQSSMTSGQIETSIRSRLQDLVSNEVVVTYSVETVGEASVANINASFTLDLFIPFVPAFSVPMVAETRVPFVP